MKFEVVRWLWIALLAKCRSPRASKRCRCRRRVKGAPCRCCRNRACRRIQFKRKLACQTYLLRGGSQSSPSVSRVKSAISHTLRRAVGVHASTRVPSTPPSDSVLDELTAVGVRPRVADRQFPCLSKAECRIGNHGVRELGAAAEQNCRNESKRHRAGRAHVGCGNASCA